mmetsp:Transcript_46058/g.144453  ORF Transcript_46058/g.144453 Transcript_46058/m.144453 type:complete len:233 (+) Transcript_46058:695-1393(+)
MPCVGVGRRRSQRLSQQARRQLSAATQTAVSDRRGADQEHAGVGVLGTVGTQVYDLHLHAMVFSRKFRVDLARGADRTCLPRHGEPEHAHTFRLHARAGGERGNDLVHLRARRPCARTLPLHEAPAEVLQDFVRRARCLGRHWRRCAGDPLGPLHGAIPRVRPVQALAPSAASHKGAEGGAAAAERTGRRPGAVLHGAVPGVRARRAAAVPAARRVRAEGGPAAAIDALPRL